MVKIKLTPKQKEVVKRLQNGYVLITDCDNIGAWVGSTKDQFYIGGRVFWNLVHKGIIYQELGYPFNYVLTQLGKTIQLK